MQNGKTLMQVFDADYIVLNSKPIVRLFGKTETGGTVCAIYDRFLPYFYVQCPEEKFDFVIAELKKERAVEQFDPRTKKRILVKKSYDVVGEPVERFLPIGYGPAVKLLKIICHSPSDVPEMRAIVERLGHKAHEADTLFKYRFMVDNFIKGMNWVEVDGKPISTNTIKCQVMQAESFKPVDILKNAPLKYMALDIETLSPEGKAIEMGRDKIIAISLAFSADYRGKKTLVLLAKNVFGQDADTVCCANEEEMLKKFLEIVNDYDPDILIGYNINNFDIPYIDGRMRSLKISRDFSRADKPLISKKMALGYSNSILGRVIVDPYEIIKRDVYLHFKRHDLGTIGREMLGIEKLDMGGPKGIRESWEAGLDGVRKLVAYTRRDSEIAMKLVLERGLIDKFLEIAKVSGLLLQDAFSGQSQRIECMILHEFRDRKFVMPMRPDDTESARRKAEKEKRGLKGATVLEPVVGLHTDGCILVLDFASLYPSLIKTFNICPTTLLLNGMDAACVKSPIGASFVKPEVRQGVLPKIVKNLLDARAVAKKQYRAETNPEIRKILDAKQYALKILANSVYGYSGFERARLYTMEVAGSITGYGRENIGRTTKLIEDAFKTKVIYGDTDSIFVKTEINDLDRAQALGEEMATLATKNLNGLELKFEKIFKTFLILTKKRYAGWSFERDQGKWKIKIDMKGIETVRRDWCGLVGEAMSNVLEIILKEQDVKKASAYARQIIKDLQAGRVPAEKLTVVKGISKSIESYGGLNKAGGKISAPAHVQLAKKIQARDPSRGSMVGERIPYVIIKGNQMLSLRAEDPDFVKEKGLEIDGFYYVENQLLPPLERIFEACGIAKAELIEGSRQKSLFEMANGKTASPEQMVLQNFDGVVCKNCAWTFRRPPLVGHCPSCSGNLYFSSNGSMGKFVAMS